jgi:lantibiotic leader peptide-processing serine protease
MLKELQSAARYAHRRGVLLVASAGSQADDLQHPTIDEISPDYPPDAAETRQVRNNCRVAPAELPGVVTVSATGPVGYPGYTMNIAEYSSVGMGVVDVTAPGGDYSLGHRHRPGRRARRAAEHPVGPLGAFDPLEPDLPGITVVDPGRTLRLPERHLDGRPARGWGRRPDPPGTPRVVPRCGRGRAGTLGYPAGLPGRLGANRRGR